MRRVDKFLISQRPYALDPDGLTVRDPEMGGRRYYVACGAVWFRRRSGVTMACIGHLWDYQNQKPATAAEMAERHDDGRYGGTTLGRWDGDRYWGAQEPEAIEAHLALLRPMLAQYPAVPPGYDGWWTFAKPASSVDGGPGE